ncbi:MAG: CpsD/CapB family tyrosine-protein kinase [Acetivibrionales bacterium]
MSENYLHIDNVLNSEVEEAYRVLRTNIHFCALNGKLKTISVTSCNAGEGKSTTAINTAIAFSKSSLKALFVDADLRKPANSKNINYRDNTGLTSYLSGICSLDEVVKETNIANLQVIPSGPKPPNPTELLSTDRFKRFAEEVRSRYDIVLFDTPPLGSVIDCAIISTHLDGVIIVIETDRVDYKRVQKIKDQLEKTNSRIIGVVLNKLKRGEIKNYYSSTEYTKY